MRNNPTWFAKMLLLTACAGCVDRADQGMRTEPSTAGRQSQKRATVRYHLCRAGLPTTESWKCDPVLADVNGDGNPDLAAHVRLGVGPTVWLGDGKGNWTESSAGLRPQSNWCGGGVGLGDVNRDGKADLVVADHCQGLFVFLGDGTGRWEGVVSGLYPQSIVPPDADVGEFVGAEDVALGDANGDGNLDILAGSSDNGGGISLYLGDGTGRNWALLPGALPQTGWATRVAFADINGDGKLDVVASYNQGPRVWLGDGRGGWSSASLGLPEPSTWGIYNGLAVGDLNGDRRPDLAFANWFDGPEIYLQQEDGSWKKCPDVFPELLGGGYGLALGDLDGDQNLDIAFSGRLTQDIGYVYGIFALYGDGRGGFRYETDNGLPQTGLPFTWGIALADANRDGSLDVFVGSGGIVATNPRTPEPLIPAGMLAYCGHPLPR